MGIIKRCEECGKPETDQCLVPSHGGINELWCLDCMRSAGRCISCATDIRLIVENYSEYDHDECPICLNKNNSMTPHILNGFSVLIPDIPEGATDVQILGSHSLLRWKEKGFEHKKYWDTKIIPPRDWQLLKLSEVTESLAREMVDRKKDGLFSPIHIKYVYKDYESGKMDKQHPHASLTSWVRAKGVSGDPYLLIKKD